MSTTPLTVERAYNAWAATYDTNVNRTRDLDARITRERLAGTHIATLVEAGCGSGKNTPVYAAAATRVVAFDFSGDMLAHARRHSAALSNVTLLQHDLLAPWPADTANADMVAFNLVLEHVEDLRVPFTHAAAACRPGGTLLMSELHPYRQYGGSQAHFQMADGSTVRVPAFVHDVSDYVRAAEASSFALRTLGEWRHDDEGDAPPRLLTLEFVRT